MVPDEHEERIGPRWGGRHYLTGSSGSGGGKVRHGIDISAITKDGDVKIVDKNLWLMQRLFVAAQMEDLGLFRAAEVLVDSFEKGKGLRLDPDGTASTLLADYEEKRANRRREDQRRQLWARFFGMVTSPVAAGDPVNASFPTLFASFVGQVVAFNQQRAQTVSTVVPSQTKMAKAARALAANLSDQGYGNAADVNKDLGPELDEIFKILSNDEIKGLYGGASLTTNDVIREIHRGLGITKDTTTGSEKIRSGAIIIAWLARHADELRRNTGQLIDTAKLGKSGPDPADDPTDQDLIDACEAWPSNTAQPTPT